MLRHVEVLEPRTAAASLLYALEFLRNGEPLRVDNAELTQLHPGDRLDVIVTGRATAPVTGIFAWGADLTWNSQLLQLSARSVDQHFATAASTGEVRAIDEWTSQLDDMGGMLSDWTWESGNDVVPLAELRFEVLPLGNLPVGLTGVQLEADDIDVFYASLGLGDDEPLRPVVVHSVAEGRQDGDRVGYALFEVVPAASAHNSDAPADVNRDGQLQPIDALLVINDMLRHGPRSIDEAASDGTLPVHAVDVDADGDIGEAGDVLAVFGALNSQGS